LEIGDFKENWADIDLILLLLLFLMTVTKLLVIYYIYFIVNISDLFVYFLVG